MLYNPATAYHDMLRYGCLRGWMDQAEPRCIAFGGIPVDKEIGHQLLRVVQPAAIEVAVLAHQDEDRQRDEVVAALNRDLEAACYSAQRAGKQFDAVDPENRLVADELERRWNVALAAVHALEQRIAEQTAETQSPPLATLDEFADLAQDLEQVWDSPSTDARLKKRIVQTLIEEVIADVDPESSEVVLQIHWKGGVHTELRRPRRRRGQMNHTSKDVVTAVRSLARICSDDLIAGTLNRNGLRTGRGNRWTRERVVSLRNWNEIPCYSRERCLADGWLNLTDAATTLDASPATLRLAIERGEIAGEHPLPDGPWVIQRQVLSTPSAKRVAQRARERTRNPAKPTGPQKTLDLSST